MAIDDPFKRTGAPMRAPRAFPYSRPGSDWNENSDSRARILIENVAEKNAVLKLLDFYSFNFCHIRVPGIVIDGCRFWDCNFTHANFAGSVISNSVFSGSQFNGADFSRARLSNVDLSGANLSDTDFQDALLEGVWLFEAVIDPLTRLPGRLPAS